MKLNLSKFFNILFLWGVCIAINSIAFLFVYYKIQPSNKTLALHYNILVGVDLYGKGKSLYEIPAIALLITIVNFIFFKALKKQPFLGFLSLVATFFVQILMFISLFFLAHIN